MRLGFLLALGTITSLLGACGGVGGHGSCDWRHATTGLSSQTCTEYIDNDSVDAHRGECDAAGGTSSSGSCPEQPAAGCHNALRAETTWFYGGTAASVAMSCAAPNTVVTSP